MLLERRSKVADLYVQGHTQTAIGNQLGVSQGTISGDLIVIRKEWLASTIRDFDLARRAFAENPLEPAYGELPQPACFSAEPMTFHSGRDGVVEIGASGPAFGSVIRCGATTRLTRSAM